MSMEFTGERVIPGQVDQDLFNEHFARYMLAAELCAGKRVLDAGCGAGYGAHAIALVAAQVVAMDIAGEAVGHAAIEYARPGLNWLRSSCTDLPFPDRSFDVVVAFEVIEHLADWGRLITEAQRVLTSEGLFLVSTPNRDFYAETRDQSGPNPFHEHEFDLDEFKRELGAVFRYVHVLLQNHADCVLFHSPSEAATAARIDGKTQSDDANFYLAICSETPFQPTSFIYVPNAANLLKERGLHIRRLEGELNMKDQWLSEARQTHADLVELHAKQNSELESSNTWARELDSRLRAAGERIVDLQDELSSQEQAFERQLNNQQQAFQLRTEEIEARLTGQLQEIANELEKQVADLGRCVQLLDAAEATVIERTRWAQDLQRQLELAQGQVARFRASRWIKLGRMLKLGPELTS